MGAYRGDSPNFLDVVRCLFRGGPLKKCQGAKIYPRTKLGDTVNYQLAQSRLLGHTSVPRGWLHDDAWSMRRHDGSPPPPAPLDDPTSSVVPHGGNGPVGIARRSQ